MVFWPVANLMNQIYQVHFKADVPAAISLVLLGVADHGEILGVQAVSDFQHEWAIVLRAARQGQDVTLAQHGVNDLTELFLYCVPFFVDFDFFVLPIIGPDAVVKVVDHIF